MAAIAACVTHGRAASNTFTQVCKLACSALRTCKVDLSIMLLLDMPCLVTLTVFVAHVRSLVFCTDCLQAACCLLGCHARADVSTKQSSTELREHWTTAVCTGIYRFVRTKPIC